MTICRPPKMELRSTCRQMSRESKFDFFVLFCFLAVSHGREQCQKLDTSLFPKCTKAGIDATIRIPSNQSKELIFKSNLTRHTIDKLRRCSKYIDFLVCSVTAPQCIEGTDGPMLPCRRVCTDVLRGCDIHRVRRGDVEWFKGLCKLLPNEEPSTGKCIEPKDFKPQYRKNVPLQQNCSKLFLPQCMGFGYHYTTKTFIEQLWLSQHFDAILNKTTSNHKACKSVLRELLCTELVPACFENQSEPAIYTICKSKCQVLWKNCPVVFEKEFGIFEDCTMSAEKKTGYEGFCIVTEWPGASKWTKVPVNSHVLVLTGSPHTSAVSVGALIISIVIVIALGLLAFGVYNVFKRKRAFRFQGYYRHGDEEDEEEMTVVVST